MNLLPYKSTVLTSNQNATQIRETLLKNTENIQPAIYWRRTFHKPLWGKIGEKEFAVRPVVPYWNISPIHIKGLITDENNGGKVKLIITSPYLRIIMPLIIVTLFLLMFTYIESQQYDMILTIGSAVIAGAYFMIMIPFQIQLNKTLEQFRKWLK
jgi:hypothetical protein